MAAQKKPDSIEIRTYQVGFGDCFLLTFNYTSFSRHVLIDFGSMKLPENAGRNYMLNVAKQIKKDCDGDLDVVVATHRHKDHISGFATNKRGTGPGKVIASCNPGLVIQPWTENPHAERGATTATRTAVRGFVKSLENMNAVAESAVQTAKALRRSVDWNVIRQLDFLGSDNITNRSAVENLMTMGRKNRYVKHGDTLPLARVLPGVKVHVLGPPSLEQSGEIGKMRRKDAEEFWHLHAQTGDLMPTNGDDVLFPEIATKQVPVYARWFRSRMRQLRADMMLSIVRILDKQMNNTSLILLFEAEGKSLLFPGDAQIENWKYALGKPKNIDLLRKVDVYKVGHHGSLNATPKTLWKNFANKSAARTPDKMKSILSTLAGFHGHEEAGTEVPRSKLVNALKKNTNLTSTESSGPLAVNHIVIPLR